MSIYVKASTGARLIVRFRFIYILPKYTPLYLPACSLQSAHNCWSPSACMCAYIYCTYVTKLEWVAAYNEMLCAA